MRCVNHAKIRQLGQTPRAVRRLAPQQEGPVRDGDARKDVSPANGALLDAVAPCPVCDEVRHVVFVDGIWLGREAVVLIACTKEHVIGWHLAGSENSQAWAALMARAAAPDVVIADGGQGFKKARRAVWPNARV